ncbi:hypothetical protein MRY87_04725 [bacterium]|nr:hypothetical protein [bacterium]
MKTTFGQIFYSSLIDYAGLFPPSQLPASTAFQNYRVYQRGEDSWTLRSYVTTLEKLREIPRADLEPLSPENPLVLSLVSRDPASDLERLWAGYENFFTKGSFHLSAVEAVVPPESCAGSTPLREWIAQVKRAGERFDCPPTLWAELPRERYTDQAETSFSRAAIIEEFAINARHTDALVGMRLGGLKIRCGGMPSELVPYGIPSPTWLAETLQRCGEHALPVKLTAGLHRPLSAFPPPEQGIEPHFGYLNVFLTALLARRGSISTAQLTTALQSPATPTLSEGNQSLSWAGYLISCKELQTMRHEIALSFGSCSFTEPLVEGRKLGLV